MIHFEWLWMFALLPLPALLRWLFPPIVRDTQAALRVPFMDDLGAYSAENRIRSNWIVLLLATLAWFALISAAARPQWLGEPVEIPVSGRDIMLAVDLSGSMEREDFRINGRVVDRLTATKHVATDFIQRRVGDRIGLILFGRNAYLQTPLTFDRQTVSILLQESVIGLAGKETAIGDAIGLAIKRLQKQDEKSRVVILLTDGANTAGEISPLKAAELAAQYKLKIYTIGIGADKMVSNTFFGSRVVNPSRDLDETTLKAIADKTGGRYFRARDTQQLEKIYQILDELEPMEKETQSFRPVKALFFWPLTAALLLAAVIGLLRVVSRGAI